MPLTEHPTVLGAGDNVTPHLGMQLTEALLMPSSGTE